MKPTFSVITPSFNQGKFIEKTIQSVLRQGIEGLEYLIVDGGSSDETIRILTRFGDRIRWISEKDDGQADGVNKGITATSNDIIGWLNSDDVYYPNALKIVQSYFSADPNLMVLYGDADHINVDDSVIESYYTEDWNYERLKEICYLCQPAVFFRREVVNQYGLLDPSLNYCMDYEYWLRLGAHINFKRVKTKLAGSRLYAENKTLKHKMPVRREINYMMMGKFGDVPINWILIYAHTMANSKVDNLIDFKNKIIYLKVLIVEIVKGCLRWKKHFSFDDFRALVNHLEKVEKIVKKLLHIR